MKSPDQHSFPHWKELAVFLGLILFTYGTIGRDLSNPIRDCEWARIATTFAVVERGTLAIDDYVAETADWSRHNGHYYSAKAPGPAVLAVPVYFAQRAIQGKFGVSADHPFSRNTALFLSRLFTITLPTLLAVALLYLVLVRRFQLSPALAMGVAGAWCMGSLGMIYGSVHFGHQTSAAFLAVGICVAILEFGRSIPRTRVFAIGGVSMGLAVASDYASSLTVILWTGWVFWRSQSSLHRMRLRLSWILGGAVIAIALGWYHHVCFGHFLTTPLSRSVINPRWADLNTVGAPDIGRLFQITILPWRGVFYATPVWILSLAGIWILMRNKRFRENSETVVAAISLLAYLTGLCMLPSAYGGWCLGPRYLVCALPSMLFLLIEPAKHWTRGFAILLGFSSSMMLIAALTEPLAPQEYGNPWSQFIFPRFLENTPTPQYNIFGYSYGTSLVQSFLLYAAVWCGGIYWLHLRLSARTKSHNSRGGEVRPDAEAARPRS